MSKQALVLDADCVFVEFVGELFKKRGYAVTKAYDGKAGWVLVLEDSECI